MKIKFTINDGGVTETTMTIDSDEAIEGLNEAIVDAEENGDFYMANVARKQLAEIAN